jgi:hypothetical protein
MTLRKFERQTVESTAITFSATVVDVEPRELQIGDTVHIVSKAKVVEVKHRQIKDSDGLRRVHRLGAGIVALVDEELVKDVIEEQRLKIEQALGVERLDFGDTDEDDE